MLILFGDDMDVQNSLQDFQTNHPNIAGQLVKVVQVDGELIFQEYVNAAWNPIAQNEVRMQPTEQRLLVFSVFQHDQAQARWQGFSDERAAQAIATVILPPNQPNAFDGVVRIIAFSTVLPADMPDTLTTMNQALAEQVDRDNLSVRARVLVPNEADEIDAELTPEMLLGSAGEGWWTPEGLDPAYSEDII